MITGEGSKEALGPIELPADDEDGPGILGCVCTAFDDDDESFADGEREAPGNGGGKERPFFVYAYPHPTDEGRFLYVGQKLKEGRRHKDHLNEGKKRTAFGRKFRRDFPGVPMPSPFQWAMPPRDSLGRNFLETCVIDALDSWRQKGNPGYNQASPGSTDYQALGKIAYPIGGPIGGRITGPILGQFLL